MAPQHHSIRYCFVSLHPSRKRTGATCSLGMVCEYVRPIVVFGIWSCGQRLVTLSPTSHGTDAAFHDRTGGQAGLDGLSWLLEVYARVSSRNVHACCLSRPGLPRTAGAPRSRCPPDATFVSSVPSSPCFPERVIRMQQVTLVLYTCRRRRSRRRQCGMFLEFWGRQCCGGLLARLASGISITISALT